MTTDPMTEEQLASKLYPTAPTSPPEAFVDPEQAAAERLFYPDGPTPPVRKQPGLAGGGDSGQASDEAAKLYGEKPQPAAKPQSPPKTPAPVEPKPKAETATAEAEDSTGADGDTGDGATTFNEAAYDGQVVASYREAAAELGIGEDAAQQLLERVGPKLAERQAEQLQAMREGWLAEVEADPVLSKAANIETAKSVIREFGTPALTKLLNETGLGNNPELVRLMLRIGNAL